MKKTYRWIVAAATILLAAAVIGSAAFEIIPPKKSEVFLKLDTRRVLEHIRYLSSEEEFLELQYRVAGTEGERKAAGYIADAFTKAGLKVERQEFDFDEVYKESNSTVEFSVNGKTIRPTGAEVLSDGNVDAAYEGDLIDLGVGAKEDFESNAGRLDGKFVLVKVDKATAIEYFTACELNRSIKGIILYDPDFVPPGQPAVGNRFVLPKPADKNVMTITAVSREDYEYLKGSMKDGKNAEVTEKVRYDAQKEKRHSQNIVAYMGDQKRNGRESTGVGPIIYIGAHYDSVNDPGANDNASGVASLIELACSLAGTPADGSPACEIRFVAFGAEEVGLLGSKFFVSGLSQKERNRSKLMINLDGPGIGQVLIIGKCLGEPEDAEAVAKACRTAEDNRVYYKKLDFPDSDQFFFHQAGISTVTFGNMVDSRKLRIPLIEGVDHEYHSFGELLEESVVMPEGDHTLNDTFDKVVQSNKKFGNFDMLAGVVSGILEEYRQ